MLLLLQLAHILGSPAVATQSNPKNPWKQVAAPLIIPVTRYGKKPSSSYSSEDSDSFEIAQLSPFAEIPVSQRIVSKLKVKSICHCRHTIKIL